MKKSVVLIVLAVLVSLAYPFYIMVGLQTAPPEPDWSRAVDVLTIDEPQAGYQSNYPHALVDLANGELGFIYQEYGALLLKRITADGQIVNSTKIGVIDNGLWQIAASQPNPQTLAIYWQTDNDIAHTTYRLDDHTLSDVEYLDFKAKGLDSFAGNGIVFDDRQIILLSGLQKMQTFPIEKVIDLKAAIQDDVLHLFYTTRDQNGYQANYYRRDLTSNQTQSEPLYSDQKEQIWGDLQQVIVKDKVVGALYSRNGVVDERIDRALVHVVVDNGMVKSQVYRAEHILHLGQMVSIDDDGFNMVSLLNDGVGMDYYRWHTKTGIDQKYRLTNSKVLGLYPHYIKTQAYDYFYWLDIGANQKSLRMSTNAPAVVAQTTKADTTDYLTAGSVLFFTGFMTIVFTLFVPQLLICLALIYAYYYFSHRPGTSEQRKYQLLKLFVVLFLIHFVIYSVFVLLPQLQYVRFSLAPVDHPLVLLAIAISILALSAYIAKLYIKGDFANHKVLWYAVFVLTSMLLICINMSIYRPIELMLYRL